jgi:hypothetical protein
LRNSDFAQRANECEEPEGDTEGKKSEIQNGKETVRKTHTERDRWQEGGRRQRNTQRGDIEAETEGKGQREYREGGERERRDKCERRVGVGVGVGETDGRVINSKR